MELRDRDGLTEQEFLAAYRQKNYPHPYLTADLVLCSHGHADHGYRRGASLSGRPCGIRVETLETFHDEKGGALRGPNTVHILEAEGLRLVHLGDLGHMLSPEQIACSILSTAFFISGNSNGSLSIEISGYMKRRRSSAVRIPLARSARITIGWKAEARSASVSGVKYFDGE